MTSAGRHCCASRRCLEPCNVANEAPPALPCALRLLPCLHSTPPPPPNSSRRCRAMTASPSLAAPPGRPPGPPVPPPACAASTASPSSARRETAIASLRGSRSRTARQVRAGPRRWGVAAAAAAACGCRQRRAVHVPAQRLPYEQRLPCMYAPLLPCVAPCRQARPLRGPDGQLHAVWKL